MLTMLVEFLVTVACIGLLVPVAVLAAQAICAFGRAVALPVPTTPRPRMTVLIPAHDESTGLIATLRSVKAQLGEGDRCLVVADNCLDDTARIARGEGAETVERFDADRRGKGYALDFGLRALDADPPEVLVIVDADCIVGPGCLDRIGRLSAATRRPVQALYLMKSPINARRMTLIAEFAWRVKNWGRPLGFQRLGLPCPLMGAGMAFPWKALRAIDLASGHLVEDVRMGFDLARIGAPPLFCPDALVTSVFPFNEVGAKSQRTRWEHGHLAMIVGEVPGLLLDALKRRSLVQLMMTLDLAVPPLALLVMVVAVAFVITAAFAAFGLFVLPFVVMLMVGALLATAVALFWLRFGSDVVSIGTLAMAALYALKKIPVYLKFMAGRQMEWVKSKRDLD